MVGCAANNAPASASASSAPAAGAASSAQPSPLCQKSVLKWTPVGSPAESKEVDEEICRLQTTLGLPDLWKNYDTVASKYTALQIDKQPGGQPRTMTPSEAKKLLQDPASHGYVRREAYVALTGTYYQSGVKYFGKCTRLGAQGSTETIDCSATAIRQNFLNMNVGTNGVGLPPGRAGDEQVVIEIGREVFRRHFNADRKKKSCMLNTLAHEWVHTISKPGPAQWSVVTDDESAPANAPSLPQFFGSIAQCTWLQSEGLVSPGEASLSSCVSQFGENVFNSMQCDS